LCMESYDCAVGTGNCVNGVCEGFAEGQPCPVSYATVQCAPGLYCLSPNDASQGICTKRVAQGDLCYLKDDLTSNCQEGFVCDATVIPFTFSTGKCAPAYTLAAGVVAVNADQCQSGLVSSSSECLAFPSPSVIDSPCATDVDCMGIGSCGCTQAAGNNTLVCSLSNQYFLLQSGLKPLLNQLTSISQEGVCHFWLEPDPNNCMMNHYPQYANWYYCSLWLSDLLESRKVQCDTSVHDWCMANSPDIDPVNPVASLLTLVANLPPTSAASTGVSSSSFFLIFVCLSFAVVFWN